MIGNWHRHRYEGRARLGVQRDQYRKCRRINGGRMSQRSSRQAAGRAHYEPKVPGCEGREDDLRVG